MGGNTLQLCLYMYTCVRAAAAAADYLSLRECSTADRAQ
jgi:hypothetical protein